MSLSVTCKTTRTSPWCVVSSCMCLQVPGSQGMPSMDASWHTDSRSPGLTYATYGPPHPPGSVASPFGVAAPYTQGSGWATPSWLMNMPQHAWHGMPGSGSMLPPALPGMPPASAPSFAASMAARLGMPVSTAWSPTFPGRAPAQYSEYTARFGGEPPY